MKTRRQRKVADLVHEELSLLLGKEAQDPRLNQITITEVEMSADLQHATVHYTVLGEGSEAMREAQSGLESAIGFFRRALAESLSLRTVPLLRFRYDESELQGQRIDVLLDSLRKETREDE